MHFTKEEIMDMILIDDKNGQCLRQVYRLYSEKFSARSPSLLAFHNVIKIKKNWKY